MCGVFLELADFKPLVGAARLQTSDGIECTFVEGIFFLVLNRGAVSNASKQTNADEKERRLQAINEEHDERVW